MNKIVTPAGTSKCANRNLVYCNYRSRLDSYAYCFRMHIAFRIPFAMTAHIAPQLVMTKSPSLFTALRMLSLTDVRTFVTA